MSGKPIYRLTLRHDGQGDPTRALRSALKLLWRGFSLKCLDIREHPAGQQQQQQDKESKP